MVIFIISFSVIALAITGLAIGVLSGRGPLSTGGCGGIRCQTAGFGCKALGAIKPVNDPVTGERQ